MGANSTRRLRVLYLHGIGGSATDSFEQTQHVPWLTQRYDLYWTNSQVGDYSFLYRYSVVRLALADPFTMILVSFVLLGICGFVRQGWRFTGCCCFAIGILSCNAAYDTVKQRAIAACLDRHVHVNKELIARARPDVVVGFSLGGAAVAALMNQRLYNGSVVLLAPAVVLLPALSSWIEPNTLRIPPDVQSNVVVFQGSSDSVVNFQEVSNWCKEQRIDFRILLGIPHEIPISTIEEFLRGKQRELDEIDVGTVGFNDDLLQSELAFTDAAHESQHDL